MKIKVLQLIEHALFKFAKRRLQLKTVSPQKSPLEVEIWKIDPIGFLYEPKCMFGENLESLAQKL